MSKQIVTSKYFQKFVMDESLSDFQEKKKSCPGPKSNQKAKVNNKKPKRRIKGQKDIRTLIKSKKNELLSFTKDFNDVCKKSGIDVDSQQLQLAIALSKSLQRSEDETEADCSTSKLTSQERTNKIRRTLQEYGFKVPETKIILEAKRKIKRNKKPFKLLLESDDERRQKIFDKYSQVLFENPNSFHVNDNYEDNVIKSGLYFLATNITFELMKSNEIFYTPGVLQDISLTKSNLLRDWSNIPGRPASPKHIKDFVVSISEIQFTQTELDTILSGTLVATKNICELKSNRSSQSQSNDFLDMNKKNKCYLESPIGICPIECASNPSEEFNNFIENRSKMYEDIESGDVNNKSSSTTTMLTLPKKSRSLSPDIFGDEVSSLIENSIVDRDQCIEDVSVYKPMINNANVLDFNKPVEVIRNLNITNEHSEMAQITDGTKRKTNDFMDLTECVHVSLIKYNTNLVKSPAKACNSKSIENYCMEITECINPISPKYIIHDDNIDLTQEEEHCENVQIVINSLIPKQSEIILDLTQSSNSEEDLPVVDMCSTHEGSSDDTIIVHYNDCNTMVSDSVKKKNTISGLLEFNQQMPYQELEGEENVKENNKGSIVDLSEDALYTLSNDSRKIISNTIYNSQSKTMSKGQMSVTGSNKDENNDIDLTQTFDPLLELSQTNSDNTSCESKILQLHDYNKLGKKDNVSIDYDEICSSTATNEYSLDKEFDDIQSKYSTNFSSDSDSPLTSKHVSDDFRPFKLSDEEFNYSVCKSKVDNFENMRGIVVTDNMLNIDKSKNNNSLNFNYTINRSLSESDLPTIRIKNNVEDQTTETYIKLKSPYATPIKAIIKDNKISVQTPTNNEYVVKVEEVTPMLDYSAMSSPERNKELSKYGLKPFKRKRAIQLLTHLYNQTHPIIENCSQEAAPSKKLKLDSPSKSLNSKIKTKSPRKLKGIKAIKASNTKFDKENNIYEESMDAPDIKDIECSADDWVFQTREKAKVHSCRVPLHITFHNYVSCRRALREAILCYEPVNIDIVHRDLVSYGYRYNPKDLLKFLDKKCITVKTADNNARNSKKENKL